MLLERMERRDSSYFLFRTHCALPGSTLLSAKRVDKLPLLFRGFAHSGCEVRWSTQYIPHEKYEVSHGILHGQAVIWCLCFMLLERMERRDSSYFSFRTHCALPGSTLRSAKHVRSLM